MSKLIDLTDRYFGKLHVIKRVENAFSEKSNYTETQWLCECECGNTLVIRRSNLIYHGKEDCGCVKKPRALKHGKSHTKIHQKWLSMKDRCYCKSDASYKNYGGRGIKVCDEWLGKNGAENFIRWAYENGWDDTKESKLFTLDRIDVNGNYEPSNCRLVGNDVQSNNKTNTIFLTYMGETMSLSQMCRKYGVKYHTAYDRHKKGYSVEEILFNKPWERNKNRIPGKRLRGC